MIRKLLVIAAAIAMPVSAVAAIGVTSGVAAAKGAVSPDPGVTCTASATVTFASPGLSQAGATTTAKTTATTTTPTAFGGSKCTGGSSTGYTITSKATKCAKKGTQPASNPACAPGFYGYDSWANFTSGGTTSIQKALKKLSFTVNGIAYQTKTSGSSEVVGGVCGSEVGFQINGAVTAPKQDKGQTAVLTACLGDITGTGLAPGETTFFDAASTQVGTVETAAIDPADSTLVIAGGS
jgi:hypothetical protein